MKFRLAVISFATLFCMVPTHAESSLIAKFSEQEPWEFMEYQLNKAPSERVKSYFRRKFNLCLTTFLWIFTFYTAKKLKDAQSEQKQTLQQEQKWEDNFDYVDSASLTREIRQAHGKTNSAETRLILSGGSAFFLTLVTLYRNNYSLVRSAEKEIFGELLDNWETTQECLPRELVPTFQAAIAMRQANPEQFNRELPGLIKVLKKQTERHKKDAHYFAISESLEKLGNTLLEYTTVPTEHSLSFENNEYTDKENLVV